MGVSIEQCNDMIHLAKEKDRMFAVGHELRLSSMWGKAKQMIDEGYATTFHEGIAIEARASLEHLAGVTPEAVAERRAGVQQRGRTQQG